jgi:integrase
MRRLAKEQDDGTRSVVATQGAPQFSGETTGEVVSEVRGYLKAMTSIVSREPPPTPPHLEPALEGMRGLVGIARELAKGPSANRVVVDNAELLKTRYVELLSGAITSPAPPSASQEASPLAGSREASMAERRLADPIVQDSRPTAKPATTVPAFELDRRYVERPASSQPLFSAISNEYLAARRTKSGDGNADIETALFRRDLFIELIGDHPVDTYSGTDLQAYVALLKYWPASVKERPSGLSAREVIAANQDLSHKPLGIKTLREGYVANIKAMMRSKMTEFDYRDPFSGVRIFYPETAAPSQATEPLSADQISRIFKTGVGSGLIDEAMLPLLGHLTGRRLGLLVHLMGSDFREKYRGVWVAQTVGIIKVGKSWKRIPIKTDASMTFFVMHDLFREIGFVEWAAARGDQFLFPELMRLADPSKSASAYMSRLFEKAGVTEKRKEVFHSLRGGNIELMRDNKVDTRDRKLQAGHTLADEHDFYGFRAISESRAREMARAPLMEGVDYSRFKGLDFDRLARGRRVSGRRGQN